MPFLPLFITLVIDWLLAPFSFMTGFITSLII